MLHLEKPFYFTVNFDCYCTWPTEVHSTVSYQYVNLDICREVWSFAALVRLHNVLNLNMTIFFLCLTKIFFNRFSVQFKSILLGALTVPQLISVVECELRNCNRRAVFSFNPCCIDLYTLYWNNVLCRLQLWKCV